MRLKAMAKINLALDVIGERPDGYHDVRMVMQTIGMYDTLELTAKKEPGIRLTANLPFIPVDGRNLVWKAADLLMKEFGVSDGVRISLHKFIPVAAGLAGGSSDAAAALIRAEFDRWEGCEMHSLRYAGDEACTEENLAWMNSLKEESRFTRCIEFVSDFHSPAEGGGAWAPDEEYTDWQWWLAGTEDGDWVLVTWGY